ncbi:MAG: HutD family protein [Propionibacteriaceae bacterium]
MRTISQPDLTASLWSGGMTWEFFLSPADGSYAQRDFDLRISSASITTSESTFTALPGVDRWLAVCQPIALTINGRPCQLAPGQIVAFRGEDQVTSVGATQDLNVMARRGLPIDVSWTEQGVTGPALLLTSDANTLHILDAGEHVPDAGMAIRYG